MGTGAEKYLAGRMKSASYADAYRRARARIASVDEFTAPETCAPPEGSQKEGGGGGGDCRPEQG